MLHCGGIRVLICLWVRAMEITITQVKQPYSKFVIVVSPHGLMSLNTENSGYKGELLIQFSTITVRGILGTTGRTCLKSSPSKIIFLPNSTSTAVLSRNNLAMVDKAWRGTMEASSMMYIVTDRRKVACRDVGETLHMLVSIIGTGSLNRLCTVLPPSNSVATIPVEALRATLIR